MSQLALEFADVVREAARAGRDAGAKRAVDHADRLAPGWSDVAYGFFCAYARRHHEFMTEAARRSAEAAGFPRPPDKRAWGHVALRAAREGVVTKIGWATASDPKVHCNPASLWASNVVMGHLVGKPEIREAARKCE